MPPVACVPAAASGAAQSPAAATGAAMSSARGSSAAVSCPPASARNPAPLSRRSASACASGASRIARATETSSIPISARVASKRSASSVLNRRAATRATACRISGSRSTASSRATASAIAAPISSLTGLAPA